MKVFPLMQTKDLSNKHRFPFTKEEYDKNYQSQSWQEIKTIRRISDVEENIGKYMNTKDLRHEHHKCLEVSHFVWKFITFRTFVSWFIWFFKWASVLISIVYVCMCYKVYWRRKKKKVAKNIITIDVPVVIAVVRTFLNRKSKIFTKNIHNT